MKIIGYDSDRFCVQWLQFIAKLQILPRRRRAVFHAQTLCIDSGFDQILLHRFCLCDILAVSLTARQKKYRIRIYDCSERSIRLERKKKFGSFIYKESAPLTKEEVWKILDGDYGFLLKSPYPLCREFYVECVSSLMRPRTIVDYDREPWIMDEGTVRITFDADVRAAVGSFDLFDSSLPTLPVLEPGKLVMEVKFTEMLPQIVREILPPQAEEFTAVSKYVLCYEKTRYMNGFEYWYETQERKLL